MPGGVPVSRCHLLSFHRLRWCRSSSCCAGFRVCRKPLGDESHDVLCRGLTPFVLLRQFVDETRVYPYRVEVRTSALSFFESFVAEFLWKGSTHRLQQLFHVGCTRTRPQ